MLIQSAGYALSGGANVFPLNSNVNLWTLVGLSLGMIEVVEKICLHFFQVLYSGHLGFSKWRLLKTEIVIILASK